MNVKELKEILVDIPDEYEIVLSSDEEGNSWQKNWQEYKNDRLINLTSGRVEV